MKKLLVAVGISGIALVASAGSALADEPAKIDAFVQPMVGSNHVLPEYHILPVEVTVFVPDHATNLDGYGIPIGPYAMRGEENYSPLWAESPYPSELENPQ